MNKLEIGFLVKKQMINRLYVSIVVAALICLIVSGCKEDSGRKVSELGFRNNRTYVDSVLNRANDLYSRNNYAEAVREFTVLIKLDSIQGEYYYKRGYSYTKLLLRKSAIDDFKKAITFSFKPASSCYNIGINCSYDNDSLALYYFRKCVKFDPSYSRAYIEINDCEERLKKRRIKLVDTSL